MDFYNSNRENKYGKRAGQFSFFLSLDQMSCNKHSSVSVCPGFLGHKSASKSNPSSPPHPTEAPLVTHFGIKRSESEYAFPVSDDHTTHWKQQQHASERVPNSGHRPPVYRHSTVQLLILLLLFNVFDLHFSFTCHGLILCFKTPARSSQREW